MFDPCPPDELLPSAGVRTACVETRGRGQGLGKGTSPSASLDPGGRRCPVGRARCTCLWFSREHMCRPETRPRVGPHCTAGGGGKEMGAGAGHAPVRIQTGLGGRKGGDD